MRPCPQHLEIAPRPFRDDFHFLPGMMIAHPSGEAEAPPLIHSSAPEKDSLHPPPHHHVEPRPILCTIVSHRWLRQREEFLLVEDTHAELLRLARLRTGVGADENKIRLA